MIRSEREFLETLSITIGVMRSQHRRGVAVIDDDLELLERMAKQRIAEIEGKAPWVYGCKKYEAEETEI